MAITTPGIFDYHLASQNASRALSLNPTNPCTFMSWISGVLSDTAAYSRVGLYNSATTGGTAIQIGHRALAGRVVIWTWGGGILVDAANAAGGNLVSISDNVWTHYAYTFDGTNSALYLNGSLVNVVNNTTGISSTTGVTGYAAQISGTLTSIYVNGYPTGLNAETSVFSCDDIRFYNRQLSASEILTIYTSAGDRDGIVNGLVALINASEGVANSTISNALDYTNELNDISFTGAATGVNFTYSQGIATSYTRPPL